MTNKQKRRSQLNFIISSVVAVGALVFFAYLKRPDNKSVEVAPSPAEPASKITEVQKAAVETQASSPQTTDLPGLNKVVELPKEMTDAMKNASVELPPDLKAQLEAQPPELPEDLKAQLNGPPPELPADLKAQLEAPAPELPEDMKRALATPPRVVTLDEVNTPPDTGL